jgi:GH24 family phage-related lysozyme (muramidase)
LKLRVGQSNWISAATEIKKWNKAGGVVLKGLTIRRNKEAELLLA